MLTKGWQGNVFLTAFTGQPLSVKLGSVDNSGTGEAQDRAVQIGDPKAGLSRKLVTPAGGGTPYVQWLNPGAFAAAPQGQFGTTARNAYYGPGFFTTDASLVKNTLIHEGVSLQLRAEMFNIFNHTNLSLTQSNTGTLSSASFARSTATRAFNNGSPGIGPGEPFNVQFAGKIIF